MMSAHDHGNCELCDQIEKQLALLREEIATLKQALNAAAARRVGGWIEEDQLTARAEQAEAREARLREALRKHGVHLLGCQRTTVWELGCTCGLDAVLAADTILAASQEEQETDRL